MAAFHLHASFIRQGTRQSGALGMQRYLTRHPKKYSAYTDLVAWGFTGVPAWAQDDAAFWHAADRYERRRGVVARGYVLALPRELSASGREDLATQVREAYFADFPHTWAIHCPQGSDGADQPHVHILMSPRRDDGVPRSAIVWFGRAANWDRDPALGGAPKDKTWGTKQHLGILRRGCAALINVALEQAGIPTAVCAGSLASMGYDRAAVHYEGYGDIKGQRQAVRTRKVIARDHQDFEHEFTRDAWQEERERLGLTGMSLQDATAWMREWFWQERTRDIPGYDHGYTWERERGYAREERPWGDEGARRDGRAVEWDWDER